MVETLVNLIVQGVLIGGLYALFALGLSLSLGVMRFVNIAHGDMIVLFSFVILSLTGVLGWSPFLVALILLPVAFGDRLGCCSASCCSARSARASCRSLLVTFGLSIIIQNGLLEAYGAEYAQALGRRDRARGLPRRPDRHRRLSAARLPARGRPRSPGSTPSSTAPRSGARIRAVSDDPAAADLIGLTSARIYPVAMGVVGVTMLAAAACMSVWTNFDPAIGPSRLLAAFEAVVLGGLGSLWGTLVGGIMIGVAQNFGSQFDASWQILAQHLVFLVALVLRPQGLFARELIRWPPSPPSSSARAVLLAAVAACLAGPWLFDANSLTVLTEFFVVLTLALMWNLLAGYADIISVGQQGFVGVGAYAFFGFTALAHLSVWARHSARGADDAARRRARDGGHLPPAHRLSRGRHLGGGGRADADRRQAAGLRRRLGHEPADPGVKQFGARLGDRIDVFYAMSLGLALIAFLATWALLRSRVGLGLTAMRDNEEAAGSAGVDLVQHPHPLLPVDGALPRPRRRHDRAGEAARRAVRLVQHHGLDDRRHLHRGHRRHRQPRGADHRRDRVLRAPAMARRLRRLVPDPARR